MRSLIFRFCITVQFNASHFKKHSPNIIIMLEKEQKQLKDFTILIAEDEPISYQYIEILLKDHVKRIDRATNGKEAVELALKNSYNLILMDLKMPVMSGIEATKILKQQFPDIPIIALTAYSFPKEKEIALKAGCADFLSKPFKKKELIEMINRICVKSYESTTSSLNRFDNDVTRS